MAWQPKKKSGRRSVRSGARRSMRSVFASGPDWSSLTYQPGASPSARKKAGAGKASSKPRSAPRYPKPIKRSKPEQALTEALATHGLSRGANEEHRFHKIRRWRFDFAWPELKVAVEVEGGVWSGGRHTRGAGYAGDCEKYSTAALEGWLVLRFVPRKGWIEAAIPMIRQALTQRGYS